jgi:hypothetical protein
LVNGRPIAGGDDSGLFFPSYNSTTRQTCVFIFIDMEPSSNLSIHHY